MNAATPQPDIQALIERAERHLPFVERTGSDTTVGIIRDLAAALSSLSAPAETEWEYGLVNPDALPGQYGRDDVAHLVSNSRDHIEKQWRRGHPAIQFVRRRKAGPWEVVE